MRLKVFFLLFQLFASQFAFAGASSIKKTSGCESILAGPGLLIGDSPYRRLLAQLVARHPGVRVLVSWGRPQREFLSLDQKPTSRAIPLLPFPGNEEALVYVLVHEPGDTPGSGLSSKIYRVEHLRVDEEHKVYVVRVNVNQGAFGGRDLELISLYTALSAAPYASFLTIEQEIGPDKPLAVEAIRRQFKEHPNQPPKTVLKGLEPGLVRSLRSQGEPFHQDKIELAGFVTNEFGAIEMALVYQAEEYTVEYGFVLSSPEMANLFRGTEH